MSARAGLSTGWYVVLTKRGELIAAYQDNRLARMRSHAHKRSRVEWIKELWFIHKHDVGLVYGGPEEGGWHYTAGTPVKEWEVPAYLTEDDAYAACRELNTAERERADAEESYNFTDVLAYKSTFYSYSVHDTSKPEPYPAERPHYE
jgi:hypothetical protein